MKSHEIPCFNQFLLVVPWSFVILPEFVDLHVAGGDDENVAAEDTENENSANFVN